MSAAALLGGSLVVVVLSVLASPLSLELKGAGGALLLILWAYAGWTKRAGDPTSPVRLIPGVALAFLGLGLVQAWAGLAAWAAVPPLIVILDQALLRRWRSLGVVLYVILWLDLFALVHQLVAAGRDLTGVSLLSWSIGLGVVATAFAVIGAARLQGHAER